MNKYPFYKCYVHSTSVNIIHIPTRKSYMCDTTTHNPRHPLSKGAPPKPQNILGRNLTKILRAPKSLVLFVFCIFCGMKMYEMRINVVSIWVPIPHLHRLQDRSLRSP